MTGTPVFTRCENAINYDWDTGRPGEGVSEDAFSVCWTGEFSFNPADYPFFITGDDGIRILVDDVTILDGWEDHLPTSYLTTKLMGEGTHEVVVKYFDNLGPSIAIAWWWQVDQVSSVLIPLKLTASSNKKYPFYFSRLAVQDSSQTFSKNLYNQAGKTYPLVV